METELFVTALPVLVAAARKTSTGSKCLKPKKGWRGFITRVVMWASKCGWN